MPTIAAGSSASLTLAPADYITVTTTGGAEGTFSVTPNGNIFAGTGLAQTPLLSQFGPPAISKTFGPYPMGASVTIACLRGSIDYTQTAQGLSPAQVAGITASVVDAAGNVLVSGGGGGAVVTDATTARTLTASDNGKTFRFTAATAVTVTVAPGLSSGFSFQVVQAGAGTVSTANGVGVTVAGITSTSLGFPVLSVQQVGTDLYVSTSGDIPTYAFASLPTAASNTGLRVKVSDLAGSVWVSTGSAWIPDGGRAIIGGSTAPATAPATTTEDILATLTLPGGALGTGGHLLIETFWTFTGVAGTRTTRCRLGGIGGALYLDLANATNIPVLRRSVSIYASGAQNSQVGMASNSASGVGSTTVANVASSVDLSASTTVVLTSLKAVAGDGAVLQNWSASIIRSA